ncbi:tubulin-like doman-containing protein [Cryobacterium sp. BB736]|uniref:tubulin-like doman-containing protein n=1 Tax=Cryobacterium sp. BB736 TaxID=2746963 RepID=UPI001876353B|nr:tubulin-like doman-containing protein [Cryobacterium sp. BB736]
MLRPFLLVGVGGSGGKTLRVIREDLLRRLQQAGWEGGMPKAWQFVHIDVPTVADGNDPDLPGQLPENEYQGMVGTGIDFRTIDSALVRSGGTHIRDAVAGWRPDPNRVNIPASRGAGQFRALGRVITLASLNRVHDALQRARRQLTGAEVIGELQAITRQLGSTPNTVPDEPVVIVISSIAGGTGSGAVIDVCDAIRALGDKWANEIVGLLYAPDVFDYLPAEARRGVRPNSLAAITEILSGYWNEEGATEGTEQLFSKYGVQLASARRLGPRYPFLVGARNENVTYQTQNDIYLAMGRSVASWVSSRKLQDGMSAYTQAQWASTAVTVPDRLPLHIKGSETPFVALGSARVGLGRDRFRDYASEHLARSVMERFLRRHEELRPRGDDRTERQLVQDTAEAVFPGFLVASGLDERGEDRNQIVEALRPEGLQNDLKTVFNETLQKISETIPEKGLKAADVRRSIRNLVTDRRSSFQSVQLASRVDTARKWVGDIQDRLTTLTAQSVSRNGAPVTIELLRKLGTEIKQVREELVSEAATHRRWASDIDHMVRIELDDADTAVILRTTDRLKAAVRRAVETLSQEQEAEIRDMATDLIPDLAANVLDPLIDALQHGYESLASDSAGGNNANRSKTAAWPVGEDIPARLRPAPNEFLLEASDDYPRILKDLVQRTVGVEGPRDARIQAELQIMLGTDDVERTPQSLITRESSWVPRNHNLHPAVTSAPTRALFRVAADPDDLLERSSDWLLHEGTAVGKYLAEGLREFLDPETVGPADLGKRLQVFEGQLIAALNAGAPLVRINPAVLVQVHDRHEVRHTVSFSEVPLPDKSQGREAFKKVLSARGQWSDGVAKAFSDNNGGFIDIFTVLSEPYEPVVFDSLMGPIASEWGALSKTSDQRSEFWRWRRGRPLTEALPFSPSILNAMVRGWFTAGLLDQLQVDDTSGASVFVPAEVGQGGDFLAFPWPTLTTVKAMGPDMLPAVLESISLAMLDVNSSESLAPMRPYQRLLALGAGGTDELPVELERWILEGSSVAGTGSQVDWEVRKAAAEQRLEELQQRFEGYFQQAEKQTDLLDLPGSYELRGVIRAALGDLLRAVRSSQPASAVGGFF